jgi:hypothetical protein
MYSLVSAPVLGFDLARLPGGGRVAEVLVRALLVGPEELPVLESVYDDSPERAAAWLDVARAEPSTGALQAAMDEARRLASVDDEGAVAAAAVLQRTSIGTLERLLACIRHDVFDWTWEQAGGLRLQREEAVHAVAVVCDAAAASYAEEHLTPEVRRRLTAPWVAAQRRLPEGLPELGPQRAALEALLQRVARLSGPQLVRLARASDRSRVSGLPWSRAIHDASWAVFLSDRVRPAAVAQLLLVQAVRDAGISVEHLALGAWNLLSGCTHALVVRDVIGAEIGRWLLAPAVEALGPFG